MFIYEGNIVKQINGKYYACILMVCYDEPNYDTILDIELDTIESAQIWIDDEISRLTTSKGLWE